MDLQTNRVREVRISSRAILVSTALYIRCSTQQTHLNQTVLDHLLLPNCESLLQSAVETVAPLRRQNSQLQYDFDTESTAIDHFNIYHLESIRSQKQTTYCRTVGVEPGLEE